MKIAYNPKSAGALTSAPSGNFLNAITFDLAGHNIYARGELFKGTDTTYEVFKKHTTSSNIGGYNGLVPVPNYNSNSINRFLREDSTWALPLQRIIKVNDTTILSADAYNKALNLSAGNWIKLTNNDGKVTIDTTFEVDDNFTGVVENSFTDVKVDNVNLSADTTRVLTINSGVGISLTSDASNNSTLIEAPIYKGASSSADGKEGIVPAPKKANVISYLRGDGKWVDITTNHIVGLTDYAIATTTNQTNLKLAVSDSLNTALGKLENKANLGMSAYNWYKSITAEDTDGYINKWQEIVDFLNEVKNADGDILDQFVTVATPQNITGAKTFESDLTLSSKLFVAGPTTLSDTATTRTILPNTDNTYDLGSTSKVWKNVYAATLHGELDGNSSTATTLKTSRTINGTLFNGSANIITEYWGTERNITITDGTNKGTSTSVNGSKNYELKLPTTIIATIHGNADTATTLETARTINGTSFDGSANIITDYWGDSINISIASSDGSNIGAAVEVNGSANVTLKLDDVIKANIIGNLTGVADEATILGHVNKGAANKGIYLAAGVATPMTYCLDSNVGSGTKYGVAYYSESTTISSTGAGSTGQVLTSGGGTAAPSWKSHSALAPGVTLTSTKDLNLKVVVGASEDSITNLYATYDSIGRNIKDTYVDLASAQTITAAKTFSVAPAFTASSGAPFTVTSATKVTNLNADLLDGIHATGLFTELSNDTNTGKIKITIGGTPKDLVVNYATNAGNASSSDKVNKTLTFKPGSYGTGTNTFNGSSDLTVYIPSAKGDVGLGNVQNTAFYKKVVTVNGTSHNMAGTDSNAAFGIYAPISSGTTGQILSAKSNGTPEWIDQSAITAGKLGTNAGSSTNPVYFTGGIPKACTYSLKATVNNGTQYTLAYYSGTNAISSYTADMGDTYKAIYLDGGVVTEGTSYAKAIKSITRSAHTCTCTHIDNSTSTFSLPQLSLTQGEGNYVSSISASGHTITVTRANLPTLSVVDNGTGTFVTDVTASGHTITLTRGSVTIPNLSINNPTGDYVSGVTVSGHAITLTKANLPTLSVTNGTGNYVTSISVNGHAITANRATLPTLSLTDNGTGTYLTGISVSGHAITVTRGSVTIPSLTLDQGSGNYISSLSVSGHKITATRGTLPTLSVTDNGTGTYVTDVTASGHTITLTRGNAPSITVSDTGTGTYVTDVTASGHTITLTRGNVTIPNLSLSTTGTGNAITSISVSGHTITATKGSTFITSRGYIGTTAVQASSAAQALTGITTISASSTITAGGNITAPHFYESSDIALKTNIKTIDSYDNIPVLKEFDWKEDGSHSYGLIAQELEALGYTELVNTKEDGYKTVNYSAALSLIVGKLQNKIAELEKEIEILKNK